MAKPKPLDFAHFEGVEPTGPEERTTHEAQCHCGAIAYSVTLKWPFPKNPINNCNCSICQHNGYLLVYPTRKDVVFHTGKISARALPRLPFSFSNYACAGIIHKIILGTFGNETSIDDKQDLRTWPPMNSTLRRNLTNSVRTAEAVCTSISSALSKE